MEPPINTRDPAACALAYIGLKWPLALGHRFRPRQGCTCENANCPAPGAHPILDAPPRLTEDTVVGVLQRTPGASLITTTIRFDAVFVPRRIGMAVLVRLDRVRPVPCLLYGDTAALLVLPATGRHALVHPDVEVRTGPDGWIALPPSRGARWDTPPWIEPTSKPQTLLNGDDVGGELAKAFKLYNQPPPVDVDTIRRSCETILWGSPSDEERERLTDLLRGHVQLLLPEVTARVSEMSGEWRRTAEYVTAQTARMLTSGNAATPQAVAEMATQCRALLTLHQRPGSQDERASR